MSERDEDAPAVKSSSNMGTTTDAHQALAVENSEDKPAASEEAGIGPAAPAADEDVPPIDEDDPSRPTGAKPLPTDVARRSAKPPVRATSPSREGPDAWDRAAAWILARGALPALAAITIGVLVIHARIFTGETAGDDLSFHFAEAARLADCLRNLDFDFWNPGANGGYASAYYYQVLPQLASALPAAIFGNHLFWFQLSVVLPLVLAPICAYKGMRLLGATPWMATVAAFCVAFMNGESRWGSGSAGTFNVGLYTQTWALCFFPIALGYAALWMTKGKHLAAAIAWGAFVFLCHPFAGITLGFAVLAAWFAHLVLLPFDHLLAAVAPRLRDGRLPAALQRLGERWQEHPRRAIASELWRGAVLAALYFISWMPVWLPLLVDSEGFGGFPHRVSDEVGPGFKTLGFWYADGRLLDWLDPKLGRRLLVLTIALPIVVLLARAAFFRWLWAPAVLFALLLGLGPNIGKIGDDLFPPVRFLGGMQTVLAMGIGAGAVILCSRAWDLVARWPRAAYWLRTVLVSAAAVLVILVVMPGSKALASRVRVLDDNANTRPLELRIIGQMLANQPQGRKQSGPGAENHWWNLLPYAYHRVPTTLQMGGGGLQASPNYDFLYSQRDYVKNAWIFDAPYLVFMTSLGRTMPVGPIIAKTFNYEIRRLPTPGLVSPVRVVGVLPPGYDTKGAGHKAAVAWARGDQPMRDEVLAYVGGEPANRDAPAGRTLRAWRQDSPGSDPDIVAELDVQSTTTFTVRESWHPRWHAYLDGEEIAVHRVTPDFIAVDVPPGAHTLALRFERPWWAHASWLAWPLTALAAWYVQRRRRRSSTPAAT